MTTAPPADQRRLLDLQHLDTRAAKLAHERRSLPALAALSELEGRAEDLRRAQVVAQTEASDVRREVERAEADVEQVRTRAERTRARYDSGEGLSRELVALQEEIAALERRQSVLEEIQLDAMGRLEAAEQRAAELESNQASLRADQEHRTAERDREWARLDGELDRVRADRESLAASLRESSDEMVDLYERARENSGGLGAVAMHGHRPDGVALDLTLAELGSLDSAKEDDVVLSEERGYVLVRLGEDR